MRLTMIAAALVTALVGGSAGAQTVMEPTKVADTAKGKTLVDARGMTLYIFDRDTAGKSACNGPCAANWPPLTAMASSKAMGEYTVVTRDDGVLQWAYKGKPLYTWAKDAKMGDVTGDGFNNVWHVAQP